VDVTCAFKEFVAPIELEELVELVGAAEFVPARPYSTALFVTHALCSCVHVTWQGTCTFRVGGC